MLAAHMGFSAAERDRVRRFWDAPNLVASEGLKAVDMFEAVADGRIKALWIMGTNPAVSLPRADAMRDALAKLELLVVSENVASNDTLGRAHIALAHDAGEVRDRVPLDELAEAEAVPALDALVLEFDFYGRLIGIEVTNAAASVLPPALLDSAERT